MFLDSPLLLLSGLRFARFRRSCPPLWPTTPHLSPEPALPHLKSFQIAWRTVSPSHRQRGRMLSPGSGFLLPRPARQQELSWFPRESGSALSPPPPPRA